MVEWKELGEVLDYIQPTKYRVKSTNYNDNCDTPVLTAGQSLILGYTDEKDGIFVANKKSPTIIFDDFTTSFHWIDFNFKVKSSAMKMLVPKAGTNFRYIYYAMQQIDFIPTQHQRHWISKYSHFHIPFPPLSEQNRIVDILDTLTSNIDNLKNQIEQRQKQYEFYREQLLDLEGKEGVEWKKLWEVTIWDKKFNGLDKSMQPQINKYHYFLANELAELEKENGDIRILYTTDKVAYANSTDVKDFISEGEVVAIPWGGNVSIKYYNGRFVTADNRIATSNNVEVLNNKYLYYWMLSRKEYIGQMYRGAGIKHPSMLSVLSMQISIPSIEEQERIVGILDTFTESIKNLESQLTERQKQYEYYRNQLLTFE